MRVQPRAWIPIALFVTYVGVVFTLWKINDVDYLAISDSAATIRDALIVPIGAGAVLLVVATTYLGWWKPAMVEGRTAPKWMIALPLLLLLPIGFSLVATDWGNVGSDLLLNLAVGVLLVGFSEELVTRGVMLVGLRARFGERLVWLISTVLFSLLHAINAFVGQGVSATISQMVIVFFLGSAFYVTRRVTGSLIWAMLLHAAWDFSSFAYEASDSDLANVGGLVTLPLVGLTVVAVIVLLARPYPGKASPGSVAR
ncbi:CPBP family intramembrane glutamic endopeptidase [Demequina aurantiaca]|uniref:CPBP family intramembrane glutamic endopeptidase n=1 Tax=Demequina aurantiaca TaxID=676200 RepID=UPI000A688857|nr:CPBP family intramembrane glutamic endopeptidase [Demequina aurantiaca]